MRALPESRLEFSWTNNSGMGKAQGTDKVFIAAYVEEPEDWCCWPDIALRSDAACTLDISGFSGRSSYTYLGFFSADEREVTDSIYTGPVTLLQKKNIVLLSNS